MPIKKEMEREAGVSVVVTEKALLIDDEEDEILRINRNDAEGLLSLKVESASGEWEMDLEDAEVLIETIAELAGIKVSFK